MPLTSPLPSTAAKWRLTIWSLAALVMLVPTVAQLTVADMNWDAFDFGVFAAMLLWDWLVPTLQIRAALRAATRRLARRQAPVAPPTDHPLSRD